MKFKYFSILFILSVLLSACNTGIEPKEYLGEIYSVALNSIMEQDEALSSDMEYIAIDMSNFEEVDESDKDEILSYFKEKYKVEVMDATLEQLKEKGLYNPDTMVLDGVLLRIEKVDFKFNNKVFFEGSKYRSGLGAVGVEVTVHYKDNKWKSKEAKVTWIS
ncbi:peptide ABC transporter substrate-binding protein [Bacillus sp. V3B]|uniref:peptide ABC transporter substrate-binding protein n=1 Tax=Bacillus sp. V3B TaxID=2804915 RepID=UPI00210BE6AD|nr:peptide ABC transporter substrate-binding protein [Bacillus sp. V3B]MCQ6275895.1 peptide ABC transporter substrate-binding protein [Bacillus sp. V3B]